jgi:hypothetical protein
MAPKVTGILVDRSDTEDAEMKRMGIVSFIAIAVLFATGAWAEEEKKTSEDLSYATYGESGDRVKVVVSSLAAKIEKPKQYLPLQIAIGLRGDGPEISFTYQSFQLIDGQGNYAARTTTPDTRWSPHRCTRRRADTAAPRWPRTWPSRMWSSFRCRIPSTA